VVARVGEFTCIRSRNLHVKLGSNNTMSLFQSDRRMMLMILSWLIIFAVIIIVLLYIIMHYLQEISTYLKKIADKKDD
jgi:uncharacterized membrane protein YcaP (DUF421 family)